MVFNIFFIVLGVILFILLALTSFCTFLLIYPIEPVAGFFELMPRVEGDGVQNYFRDTLILFPVANFVLSVFIEVCIFISSVEYYELDLQHMKFRYN